MELTNDVQVLLPVMVSVMVAKWIGDFFTHPVFHAHLEMKCIPFLESEPRVTIMGKKSVFIQPSQLKPCLTPPSSPPPSDNVPSPSFPLVCVCVCEREREGQTDRQTETDRPGW